MAFNPFHKFRKHQKGMMAGLVLMAMLSFVLCSGVSGMGDFATWFQQTVLGGVGKADAGKLYGKKVTVQEVLKIQSQRELADAYMKTVARSLLQTRQAALMTEWKDKYQRTMGEPSEQNPNFMGFLREKGQDLPNLEEKSRQRNPYFGGDTKTLAGLMDFLIWKHKADQLGVVLSDRDVILEIRAVVNRQLLKPVADKEWPMFEMILGNERGYSPERLGVALKDEIRVRIARYALTGYEEPGNTMMRQPGDAFTPEQFWAYYKKNCTKADFYLFPVKVEDFESRVKGTPAPQELEALYAKGRTTVPGPQTTGPAFRQPQRAKVAWVSGKSDSKVYEEEGQRMHQLARGMEMFGAVNPLAPPLATAIPFAEAAQVDNQEAALYDQLKHRYRNTTWTDQWVEDTNTPLHASSLKTPLAAASLAGQLLGSAGTGAPVLAAVPAYATVPTINEMRAATQIGTALVLAGASRTPLSLLAVETALTPPSPYLSLKRIKYLVDRDMKESLSQQALMASLKAVKKEIETLAKNKDKSKLKTYLADAAKRYHLEQGETTGFRDQFQNKFEDDPAMKPLFDVYLQMLPGGEKYFHGIVLGPQSRNFVPLELPGQKSSFLFWRSAEEPAKILPFADVQPAVEKYWRFQKARDLAREHAMEIASQASSQNGDPRKLKDLEARLKASGQLKSSIVAVPGLATWVRQTSTRSDIPITYQQSQISPKLIPDQGPTFLNELLGLAESKAGSASIILDQPQKTIYVAVMHKRTEPTMEEFMAAYRHAFTDQVFREFQQQEGRKYLADVLAGLRAEAKLTINEEARKSFDKGSD